MSRNFKNFLEAYTAYADNSFAPKQFHLWCGISILSAALERKVRLPWNDSFSYYPNLFIFLVTNPGIGKSSAINMALSLLRDVNEYRGGEVKFLPAQITEAKLIELMSSKTPYTQGTVTTYQSAGYYVASEGSNGLKEIYGSNIACMTEFYDCPEVWSRATKKDGETKLTNVCLNILAGVTFDFLGKIVTDESILGGFASRVNYVIFKDKLVRKVKFQDGGLRVSAEQVKMRQQLIDDLSSIHKLVGDFTADDDFKAAYEAWHPIYEETRQELESEKMQALLVRKATTAMKLCMILSVAESDDLVLRLKHWNKALKMVDSIEKDLPGMIRETKSAQVQTQDGLNQKIFHMLTKERKVNLTELKRNLMCEGFKANEVETTIDAMLKGKVLTEEISANSAFVRLLVNPDAYL